MWSVDTDAKKNQTQDTGMLLCWILDIGYLGYFGISVETVTISEAEGWGFHPKSYHE